MAFFVFRFIFLLISFVRILCCLAFLASHGVVLAWEENPSPTPVRAFRSFQRRTDRGLPQSTVMSLAQDDRGVLWIATLDGVATFDGTTITTVQPPSGLPAFGALYSAVARRRGGVYLGGTPGVFAYDRTRWRFLKTGIGAASLAETSEGHLWMVDQEGGLFRCASPMSSDWEQPVSAASLPGPAVAVGSPRDSPSIWVACRNGVVRVDGARIAPVAGGHSRPAPITAILVTDHGECWIGTQEGEICMSAPSAADWTPISNLGREFGLVRCLTIDRRGRIWAAGRGGSVGFGGEAGAWTQWGPRNGLRPTNVLCILADREGTLWFGLNGYGLQQWHGEEWSHLNTWPPTPDVPQRTSVFGIVETSEGGFLAAVFGMGILRWDGQRMSHYGRDDGLIDDVRCVVEPEPGLMWVGCRFGLYESRHGATFRKVVNLPAGFITAFCKSPGGTWYAGTSHQGILVNEGAGWVSAEAINAQLAEKNIRGMTWITREEMWVATVRSLVIVREDGIEQHMAESTPGLPQSPNCVLDAGDGGIWVGGMGGIGVMRDGSWRLLTDADGIPGQTIYSLGRATDGSIWAGGSAGVGHYVDGRWKVYDSRTGLIEDECNLGGLLIARDGSVLVGTMASLARFDPGIEGLPAPPLRCQWQELPPLQPDGAAHLTADQRQLRLAWAAPWLGLVPVEYRTRVLRLRPEWSPPGKAREMTLENMGAGEWTVEVSARLEGSGEFGWSPPIHLKVVVAPHLWETRWAQIGGALLAIFAVLGVVRLRTRQLRLRAEKLQQGIDEAVANMKILRGLLPICAHCKKVRDDAGYWKQIETYIRDRSEAEFSHSICPECFEKHYPEYSSNLDQK